MTKSILKSITAQARKTPNKVVYDYLGKLNTYEELDAWSSRVATYIRQQDLKDTPVMVYGGQTFDMLVAFLGITKAGHAYIPVDINSSPERLNAIIETAQPALIISVEDFPIEVTNDMTLLEANALKEIYNSYPMNRKEDRLELTENFYIIFTSGTTGKPKGVQITHENLVSFVNWMTESFDFDQKNTMLQPAFSFDLSVMALYPTLVNGGTLKVMPKQITDNFAEMFKLLPKLDLNIWVSTPSLIEICLLDSNFNQRRYPELKQFLFCGEELSHQTAKKLVEKFGSAHIFNTYGPTETTVAVTSIEITPEILKRYDRLPIGYVKPDMNIGINLNDHENRGEMVISGPSVSRGYLNNPVKTGASFLTVNGEAAYRSGDLGYFEDDLLFYTGRSDFQIKLNGYRIELEEINHYLSAMPFVKQGVAVPKYDQNDRVQQLVAEVVLDHQEMSEPDIEMIKQKLGESVMPYMIPQRYVFREELPLSMNGKVDIKALIAEVNNHD
ncbi:D-alanine--poly(phosphoribitol) ligase subunit DltA [Levilactobacillus brevis]|uniref:D-alanine--poly(phosphoribitol) ligase subunit DltA n=1 Tax=Levilactobacillus brevis TaxID=1580 RepID=UPI001118C565|nr:D-alanine--poly(phosphoribitol) ligase subunit DltA [Levilactobacillus brevis]QCZ46827.1 Hypothetical protein UCCLB556_1952 [Levilactobacillus brevis]